MSGKLNMKSIIAIAAVTVLTAIAIIGTVVFLKDKGTSEATEIASENGVNGSGTETINVQENGVKETQEQNGENNGVLTTEGITNNNENNEESQQGTNQQNANSQINSNANGQNRNLQANNYMNGQNLSNTNSNIQNDGQGNNSQGTDNIEGSTIRRVTEGDLVKVTDDKIVRWTPISMDVENVSAKIRGENNKDIEINKMAISKTGTNLIRAGEEIIYRLEVKNTGKEDYKNIEVADNIPENTTYVETDDNSIKIKENDKVIGLKWYVDIKSGETVGIQFTVRVNENITGTISNMAIANGTPSEEIKTAIIEQEKTSAVSREFNEIWKTIQEPAKINDRITYTITVRNTGDIDGKTTVKDEDLKGILADGKAEMVGEVSILKDEEIVSKNKTAEDLINGIKEIEVPAHGVAKVVFTVKINKIKGEITNVAFIGDDEEVPTDPDVTDTVNITAVKANTPKDKVKEKEFITYTITLSNSGNKEGSTIVKDKISEYTTFVEKSIKINDKETQYTQNNLEDGISVSVPAGENTATLSFVVKVKPLERENVEVKNIAIIDGNETNEVTNEAEKEKISLTVNKIWSDNLIQAQKRPEKIKFILTKNGEVTETEKEVKTADIANKSQIIVFDNLNKYDAKGNPLKYGIEEVGLNEFYKSSIISQVADEQGNESVEVENKFTVPEDNETQITVTKIWDDNDNKAQKRSEKVKLKVTGENTVAEAELSTENSKTDDENTWTKVMKMPKYNQDGQEIKYVATEEDVPRFYEKTEKDLTVINKFVGSSETVSIKINKKWKDNETQKAHRPEQIIFEISDGKDFNQEVTFGNEENATKVINDLPKYDKNADEIKYIVTEKRTGLKFYTTESSKNVDGNNIEFNFENTFEIPEDEKETEITLIKRWEDNNNKAGKRPENVVFEINGTPNLKNSIPDQTITGDKKEEEWKKTIKVEKYNEDGVLINYSATEPEINSEFYKNVDTNPQDLIITNKFEVPETTIDLIVNKTWEDNKIQAQRRPETLTFQLIANKKEVKNAVQIVKVEREESVQKIEFKGLKKYDENGDLINYDIKELENTEFYKSYKNEPIRKDDGNIKVDITNKFELPSNNKTKIIATKIWDDTEAQEKNRQDVEFKIKGARTDGKSAITKNITIKKPAIVGNIKNEWTKELEVQKYDDNGQEIKYSVKELTVPKFYQVIYDENTPLTITNKFIGSQETITLKIKKNWDDNKNKAAKRPTRITLQLNRNNEKLSDVVLTPDKWETEITNLLKYDENGDEITYTINEVASTEENWKFYKQDETKTIQPTEENGYTAEITNKFVKPTDTKEIEISKKWNDNKENHQDVEAKIIGKVGEEIVETNVPNQILNQDNSFKKKVNVPVYDDNADRITYSVQEVTIPDGYIVTYNGLEIINTLPSINLTKTVISVNGNAVTNGSVPEVKKGDVVGYKIIVTNTSSIPLTNVQVTDNRKISFANDGVTNVTNAVGTISVLGEKGTETSTKEFIVYYKVLAEDTNVGGKEIINTATAVGHYIDSNNNEKTSEAKDDAKVIAKSKVEFTATKSSKITKASGNKHNDVAEYGDTIKYVITVTNIGNATGTTIVKDKVPENTTLLTTGTNLTTAELNDLKSNNGLAKVLEISAGNSKTVEFTVKVTGKPGAKIANSATYRTPEGEDKTVKDPKEYQIEKQVTLTINSEKIKTTNSNIVLVIDISGSMKKNGRLTNAKTAASKLIDGVDFTSGGQVGIVTFSSGGKDQNEDNARKIGTAKNTGEATTLKNKVDNLTANGGTRIGDGLVKAKEMIEAMAKDKPANKNIVIVLSDGAYNVNVTYDKHGNKVYGNELLKTGGEKVSNVTSKANELKSSTSKPIVYSIAIVGQNESSGNTKIMTEIIPSSTKNYIKATDGYDSIIAAFKKVETEISGNTTVLVLSTNGKVELDNIKSGSDIIIKVNGTAITDVNSHIIVSGGKTFVDLASFEADAKIQIEYIEK